MPTAEVFNANSNLYATAVNERFYTRIAGALAKKVARRLTPRRILELGAGTGAGTVVLRRYFPTAAILATDPSKKMLAYNQEKALRGVTYGILAAEEVNCLDEKFDLVFGNMCHHWFAPGTTSKLAALLAPGGAAAFSVPVSGLEKGNGNLLLLRICKELGGRQNHRRLPCPARLRRDFESFGTYFAEKIILRETHSPAFWATLLRARGSWAYLFGNQAAQAESLWQKLSAGCDAVTLYWHIVLVVAKK
ncbi:class I SAM-dependent methyltransferase [Candidatus Desulforudis audaxviator]|uniref:Methyltransferase type 11 n=1 Tax=Desulforudis audaxviator (strain MP104C) TaxID=477974 RepID=B1I4G3_DESAP|nr:class I SAM-dependent methyltransferase [Candidatus Desulforudis audaxviator]ACA59840.1 Methyltransferase type 11 [Candidatus Desulforudis audaxviator MP104C]AZK59844.1 Biotin synthesis protein BioC [Candidatus Desulforudis audaxviator]